MKYIQHSEKPHDKLDKIYGLLNKVFKENNKETSFGLGAHSEKYLKDQQEQIDQQGMIIKELKKQIRELKKQQEEFFNSK
ncbi:hypothetical protein AAA799E16_01408 [Marine Group I thaumarchaeote SCGC AAA799-E16]|uniref:Uncharacterized protein n=1 Tax=Marine Group I thaumarchaeote SCGC AAA799-E16 TaxID=1502292 RepID=A0A081S4Q5_9ARCH|nr:hypothetical protein AAA799E16_01408 [Marine Group I thaumarchaeote SCGC AAA799-E16]